MQRNLTVKPVRGNFPDKEWVRLMWQWCVKVVQKSREKQKNGEIFRQAKDVSKMADDLEAVSHHEDAVATVQ